MVGGMWRICTIDIDWGICGCCGKRERVRGGLIDNDLLYRPETAPLRPSWNASMSGLEHHVAGHQADFSQVLAVTLVASDMDAEREGW